MYADVTAQGLTQVAELGYEIGEYTNATVAGQEYLVMPATVGGGPANQNYLIRKDGNYMITIIATSIDGSTAAMALVNSFTTVA